jgi:hypothetical protein
VNTIASNENNRGANGLTLLDNLEEVGDGPVVAAKLKQWLAEADIGQMKSQWTNCCGHTGPQIAVAPVFSYLLPIARPTTHLVTRNPPSEPCRSYKLSSKE